MFFTLSKIIHLKYYMYMPIYSYQCSSKECLKYDHQDAHKDYSNSPKNISFTRKMGHMQ
jgi:hypothetical protein